MSDYSTKSCCVVDNGIFSELARTLSSSFGKVWYTSPWVSAFPFSSDLELGEGDARVERIDDVHQIIDECDLFVFPDIYQAPLQIYLESIGKRVWGSRDGDDLEIYRKDAKEHFAESGIEQGPYETVRGMTEVRKYIQAHDGHRLWIKGNKARGDFESFSVEGYDLGKNKLDDIETRLGPVAESMLYVIEPHLDDTLDLAIDTFSIDGQYPQTAVLGSEEKGECYVGEVRPWNKMPARLLDIYTKLASTLKSYGYRNFLSLESRADAKHVYLQDPCCRFGSPPAELQLNWLTNLADILWEGADGKLVEPQYAGKYGVELIVHSDWANDHPLMVDFPQEYRDKIKFRYNSEFDGKVWILPQGAGPRMAAVVACGDDLDACMETCKEISASLKGIQVESFTRAFPIIQEKIGKLKRWSLW